MKKMMIGAAALLTTASITLTGAEAATPSEATQAAFQRLLSLEGTWVGKAAHTGGAVGDATVVYRVTAGRSVLQETIFPGTAHEMVTMYHPDGSNLVLTHYCSARNQPHMVLVPGGDPNVLSFTYSGGTNMRESDLHMHSVHITFVDADHITSVWTSMKDGRPAGEARFDLTRQK